MDYRKLNIYSKHRLFSTGTTQLRCENPKEYLKQLGVDTRVHTIYRSMPAAGQINLLHRASMDTYTKLFMDYVSLTGGLLGYDIDDLIFSQDGEEYLLRIGKKTKRGISDLYRKAMGRCDFITASTPYLVAKAQNQFPDLQVRLIRNALNKNLFDKANGIIDARNQSREQTVTIAYLSGSKSHDQDFLIIQDQLLKLLSSNEDCKLLICGDLNYSSEFSAFGDRFEYRPAVPYREYATLFREIDINLVPLDVSEPFNHAKSELKYIEAGLFSIPSVMSPTDTHQEVVDNGENGILANDDQWYEALQLLVNDASMRKRIGEAAHRHVIDNYSPTSRMKDWEALFKELQEMGKKKSSTGSVSQLISIKAQLEYRRAYRMTRVFAGQLKQSAVGHG